MGLHNRSMSGYDGPWVTVGAGGKKEVHPEPPRRQPPQVTPPTTVAPPPGRLPPVTPAPAPATVHTPSAELLARQAAARALVSRIRQDFGHGWESFKQSEAYGAIMLQCITLTEHEIMKRVHIDNDELVPGEIVSFTLWRGAAPPVPDELRAEVAQTIAQARGFYVSCTTHVDDAGKTVVRCHLIE